MKINKFLTFLGFVLLISNVIDIIYYWPASEDIWLFLTRKVISILGGSFFIWQYFIKPMRAQTHCTD